MIAAAARLRSINQPSDRALLRAAPHGGGRPTCRSVVLPLPDAPMMASKLPLSTAPLTPCRIRRLPVPSLSHVTSRKLRHAPSVPLAITMSGRGSPDLNLQVLRDLQRAGRPGNARPSGMSIWIWKFWMVSRWCAPQRRPGTRGA